MEEIYKEVYFNKYGKMIKNAKLIKVDAYLGEDKEWYLSIVYQYENDDGTHELTLPKVTLPIYADSVPNIFDEFCSTFIKCDDRMYLLYKDSFLYKDEIIKYNVHEMTLDEIEKKLGYKVKIVNKKEQE